MTWTVHLSFVIERSGLSEVVEEHCAEVDEVLRIGKSGSSEEVNGNSAILSMRGALTEISGDSTERRPAWALYGVSTPTALVGNGRDALRAAWDDFLEGVCNPENCKIKHMLRVIRYILPQSLV